MFVRCVFFRGKKTAHLICASAEVVLTDSQSCPPRCLSKNTTKRINSFRQHGVTKKLFYQTNLAKYFLKPLKFQNTQKTVFKKTLLIRCEHLFFQVLSVNVHHTLGLFPHHSQFRSVCSDQVSMLCETEYLLGS